MADQWGRCRKCRRAETPDDFLDTTISGLPETTLPPIGALRLVRSGHRTLGDVWHLGWAETEAIPGIGPSAMVGLRGLFEDAHLVWRKQGER